MIIIGTIHGQGTPDTCGPNSGSTVQAAIDMSVPKSGRSMDSGIDPTWTMVTMKASATGASLTDTAIDDSTASMTMASTITATQASASGLSRRFGGMNLSKTFVTITDTRFPSAIPVDRCDHSAWTASSPGNGTWWSAGPGPGTPVQSLRIPSARCVCSVPANLSRLPQDSTR